RASKKRSKSLTRVEQRAFCGDHHEYARGTRVQGPAGVPPLLIPPPQDRQHRGHHSVRRIAWQVTCRMRSFAKFLYGKFRVPGDTFAVAGRNGSTPEDFLAGVEALLVMPCPIGIHRKFVEQAVSVNPRLQEQ